MKVRLRLESVLDFRRVRRELPGLRRPVVATGKQHLDLGVRDRVDAEQIAARASGLDGVESVAASELRGRLRRWLVRQRLAGNYADGDYSYSDGGGGGGDGGGHGGHGGHG